MQYTPGLYAFLKPVPMRFPLLLLLLFLLAACGDVPGEEKNTVPSVPLAQEQRFFGEGTIQIVEAAKMRVKIHHDDIVGYMYAMSMWFPVRDAEIMEKLRTSLRGERIRFQLLKVGDEPATIVAIEKLPPVPQQTFSLPDTSP